MLIDSRLAAEGLSSYDGGEGSGGAIPSAVLDGFSSAMATSMLLPAVVLGLGLIAALLFERPRHAGFSAAAPAAAADAGPAPAASAG